MIFGKGHQHHVPYSPVVFHILTHFTCSLLYANKITRKMTKMTLNCKYSSRNQIKTTTATKGMHTKVLKIKLFAALQLNLCYFYVPNSPTDNEYNIFCRSISCFDSDI